MKSDLLKEVASQEDLWKHTQLRTIKELLQLDALILLNQTHSTVGVSVLDTAISPKKNVGDFLVTQRAKIGLAVYTADCLPIVLYDPYNHAIGIAHAGWVGSIDGIVKYVLKSMGKEYSTRPDQLRVFFGPSAHVCCYEVQSSFIENLEKFSCKDQVIIERSGKYYFDLPLFNRLLLEDCGVNPAAFETSYSTCTICNEIYCSSRRSKGSPERQLTIVTLK